MSVIFLDSFYLNHIIICVLFCCRYEISHSRVLCGSEITKFTTVMWLISCIYETKRDRQDGTSGVWKFIQWNIVKRDYIRKCHIQMYKKKDLILVNYKVPLDCQFRPSRSTSSPVPPLVVFEPLIICLHGVYSDSIILLLVNYHHDWMTSQHLPIHLNLYFWWV